MVEELGLGDAVVFAGYVENARMPELYRSAAVAINPSLVDNMPIPVLEALASGVPVVSTDVGGVPHLVEDGRTALRVPPRAPERMAEAVLRLLRDPDLAAWLADAGRAASREYSWDRVRERLFAVYGQALTAAGARQGGSPVRQQALIMRIGRPASAGMRIMGASVDFEIRPTRWRPPI